MIREKDKVYDKATREAYFSKVMTGAEAYRVFWLCMDLWYKQSNEKDTFLEWLAMCMWQNPVCHDEFLRMVKEMIEEREEYGNDRDLLPHITEDGSTSLKPCNCCDKCRFKEL